MAIQLYSARVCPFAQRTRALLTHLHQDFDEVDVDLSNRDPELLRLSPTGKVPFLVDGDLRLFESQVIGDYLAERFEWRAAYAGDLGLRARQRLAMARWDQAICPPAFYRAMRDPQSFTDERREEVVKELSEMDATVRAMGGDVECLLAFHVAPFWARARWLAEHVPLVALIGERFPELAAWLDRTAEVEAVQATLPPRDETVALYEERYVGQGA